MKHKSVLVFELVVLVTAVTIVSGFSSDFYSNNSQRSPSLIALNPNSDAGASLIDEKAGSTWPFSLSSNSSFKILNASSTLNEYLTWVSQVSYSNGTFAIAGGNGLITFAASGGLHPNIAISGSTGFQSYVSGYSNGYISAGTNYLPGGGLTLYNYSITNGNQNLSSLLPSSWTESNSNISPYMAAFAVGDSEFLIVDEDIVTGNVFVGILKDNSFTNITGSIPRLSAPADASYGGGNFLLLSSNGGVLINAATLVVQSLDLKLVTPPSSYDDSMIAWDGTSFLIADGHSIESYDPSTGNSSVKYQNNTGIATFVDSFNGLSFFGIYQDSNTTVFKLVNGTASYFLTLGGEINDASVSQNDQTYVFVGIPANSLHSLMYLYTDSIYIPTPIPTSVFYEPYSNLSPGQSLRFNLTSFGPTGVSYGVMNTKMNISIYNNGILIHSSTIAGAPTNYSVILGGESYGYFNFNATGAYLLVENVGTTVGQFAFNDYDYYISNWTASMIEYPPQYAINIYPTSIPQGVITGLSFTLIAPRYSQPLPLAIWIGAGGTGLNGAEWWAQIGFNNWAGNYETSYAGWGIFSNIFGSPGGTDFNFPLTPGDAYNFTMSLVNNTTWEFAANGIPIIETGLPGYYNTTTASINWNFELGLETITSIAPSVNITNMISIPKMFEFLVNGRWVMATGASFSSSVGENWWNGNTSGTKGIALWGVEGSLQNESISGNSLLFGNSLDTSVSSAIPISDQYQEPLFGDFYVSPKNTGNANQYVIANDNKVEIESGKVSEIISVITYSPSNYEVIQDSNYILKPGENISLEKNDFSYLIAACDLSYNLIFEYNSLARGNSPPPTAVEYSSSLIAYDSLNDNLYILNYLNASVSVVSGKTNDFITTIPVGPYPQGIVFDPSNGYIYVSNGNSSYVSVINGATNRVIGNITVGKGPWEMTYDPFNDFIYVLVGHVVVINATSDRLVQNITVGQEPSSIAFDGLNDRLYVTNYVSDNVTVINASDNLVIGSIQIGPPFNTSNPSGPVGITVDTANRLAYVSVNSHYVYLINTTSDEIVGNISTGSYLQSITYDPINGYVYVVSEANPGRVSVINNSTVIDNIIIGNNSEGVAVDGYNGNIYVVGEGSNGSNVLTVINGSNNKVIPSQNIHNLPLSVVISAITVVAIVTTVLTIAIVSKRKRRKMLD